MNIKNIKIFSLIISIILIICCSGCKSGGESQSGNSESQSESQSESSSEKDVDTTRGYEYTKQSENLMQFYTSDSAFDAFLNEYMERHLRYNSNAVGELQIGGGNSIWKEWEAMSVMFMNTDGLSYNPKETIKAWAKNIYQDQFGYIWMDNGTDSTSWGQSWEFPNSSHSAGNTGVYNNHTYTFAGDSEGWKAYSNNGLTGTVQNGQIAVTGSDMKSVTFETSNLDEIMAKTYHAPFLELNLGITDLNALLTNQVQDIFVYWQTEGDSTYSSSKMVSYTDFATTQYGDDFPSTAKVVFPMYANSEWGDDKTVTQMKIEVVFKNGVNGSVGANEIDLSYDARQINNVGVFIAAVKNYFEYTQDTEFLSEIIGKARAAMQFYLTYCEGSDGLVTTKNFTGHNGTTNLDYFTAVNGVIGINGIGSGIGDGYWDCISYPMVSSYCNNMFYQSIQNMAYLEKMASKGKLGEQTAVKVMKPDMSGSVTYNQTESSLETLSSLCKTKYNETFWNANTGRYDLGINADGDIVDYGFTLFNQEAILYGLADETKSESIMSWINGTRTVSGDTSTGKSIYYYEFAPRWTTKNNEYQFWWRFNGKSGANYKWGCQIQNGGAAIHQSYYDIKATNEVSGADASFERFQKIESWYQKIKKANGTGSSFYSAYYDKYDSASLKLQGKNGAGAIGLDSEFLEAAILYTSVPDTYFGLGSSEYKTLDVTPNIPSSLTYMKMENCSFSDLVYDISIGSNFVQINSVRGTVDGEQIKVTLLKPSGSYEVRQHNTILTEGKDYVVSGDKIIITVPFKNGRIQVIGK